LLFGRDVPRVVRYRFVRLLVHGKSFRFQDWIDCRSKHISRGASGRPEHRLRTPSPASFLLCSFLSRPALRSHPGCRRSAPPNFLTA
jgi:hypothetical protein